MNDFVPLLDDARSRIRSPVVILLGSPVQAADLVAALDVPDIVCFQLDLHQAGRLQELLAERGLDARVETRPDLWDLEPIFQTVLFPVPGHGERELKVDLVDQAYHVLRPGGQLISLSEFRKDQFCPRWHKKVFGKCGEAPSRKEGSVFWSERGADKPRRRHEQHFQAGVAGIDAIELLSRPGVFAYGRLDEGTMALVECAEIHDGDRVLDMGCGSGAAGVLATRRANDVHITFVDSNVRAVEVSRLNAEAVGLTDFRTVATARFDGVPNEDFDVILANPPYYAQLGIARFFIESALPLMRSGGRFSIVTKQPDQLGPWVEEVFGNLTILTRRGYMVLQARAPFRPLTPAPTPNPEETSTP